MSIKDVMEKWNIFIDYDSRRGHCPSIYHQAAFSEASSILLDSSKSFFIFTTYLVPYNGAKIFKLKGSLRIVPLVV